jgi:hypothetical protein
MLAKGDRLPIAIGRDVPDGQCRHDVPVPRRESYPTRAHGETPNASAGVEWARAVTHSLQQKWICWNPLG